MKKYKLHIARDYSFEILRPLQSEILKRGGECLWFVGNSTVDVSRFSPSEQYVTDPQAIENYESCAVFSPGNTVPGFLKGIKVQVFHGLEWKKKGHFRIRDFFELYCTQGPITTNKFNELGQKHQNFLVRETGWSKLDPLFSVEPYSVETELPVVLYAPTFSEKLTSAIDCFNHIENLVKNNDQFWLIKFHPLMDKEVVARYQDLSYPNLKVVEDHSILPLLNRADIMLSDTSSVIGEFMLLGKPVVTVKNSVPDDSMINVTRPEELARAIKSALSPGEGMLERIQLSNSQLHPYVDGQSSGRILDAVDEMLNGKMPNKKLPLNLLRNFKIRKKYNYWKF